LAKLLSIFGLESIDLIRPGDDLAQIILEAARAEGVDLLDGDVVVISQKIVSKAEGLLVDLSRVKIRRRARTLSRRTRKDPRLVELILRDASRVLRADRQAFVVRRRNGFVCLNAGLDKSNVEGQQVYSTLPTDPDLTANMLKKRLEERSGKKIAVIVADTYSRPFRAGQVEFAIGVAGIEPVVDYRGQQDLFGYELKYKFVALADEIAAAAELVMGQGSERRPVAIVRGLVRNERTDASGLSKKLSLGKQIDLFRRTM